MSTDPTKQTTAPVPDVSAEAFERFLQQSFTAVPADQFAALRLGFCEGWRVGVRHMQEMQSA